MEKKGRIAALFIATAMLMPQIPAYAEGNSVVTDNGITASVQNAEAGETVTLELPEGYVEGSLVISYKDSEDKTDIPENIEKQTDGSYSFTMPDHDVQASCLVNTDADKLIVVGTTSSYYVRKDNTLEVSFDVPEGVKAEVVPLMAPYELIESELIDIDGMTKDGSVLAEQTAAVTRSTLRFHNNRVFYNAGCKYTNEAGTRQDK